MKGGNKLKELTTEEEAGSVSFHSTVFPWAAVFSGT